MISLPPVDVYADVLFLVNFGMDALCLCLTSRLLHRSLSWGRFLLAAAMGGVYGVLALFIQVEAFPAFLIDTAVCFLMCGLAVGMRRLWLTGGLYVLTSMVMGGIMTALYHWLNRVGISELLPGGEEGVSSVAFVLLAAVGGLFTLLWGKIFRKAESRRACKLTVSMTVNGHTITAQGIIDSGNLLTDPMDGTPVIVVKRQLLMPLLSPELQRVMDQTPLPLETLSSVSEAPRLRLIPVNTATGEGMLLALRPETLVLTEMEGKSRPRSVACLISPAPLESAPADALIPSSLLL